MREGNTVKQWASAGLVGLLALLIYVAGLSRPADDLVLDAMLRVRAQQQTADDVVIVAIGDDFLTRYPTLPIDRRFYARVIDTLAQAGARTIALDVFFPDPRPEQDDSLARAVLEHDVILPHVVQVPRAEARNVNRARTLFDAPPSSALSITDQLPYNPLLMNATRGVISQQAGARRMQSVYAFRDGTLPSLALAVAQHARMAESAPEVDSISSIPAPRFASLSPQKLAGRELLIDYRGGNGSFPRYSFLDVYDQNIAFADLQDKIVLVGYTIIGTVDDQIVTPFGLMAGVEVNANKVYTLLHGRLQALPALWYGTLLLVLSGVWGVLSERQRALWWIIVGMVSVLAFCAAMFWLGWFVSPLLPVVTAVLIYSLANYHHLRDLDRQLSRRIVSLLESVGWYGRLGNAADPERLEGVRTQQLVRDAPQRLQAFCDSLAAWQGVLFVGQLRYHASGYSAPEEAFAPSRIIALEQVALAARKQARECFQTGTPSYLAAPLSLGGEQIGSIGIMLAAPPSDDVRALFRSSLDNLEQLARYQTSADRLRHLTDAPRPLRSGSSERKLDALGLLADLLQIERGWFVSLLETLPQIVFVCNVYGEAIYRNQAARAFFADSNNLLVALPAQLALSEGRFREDYSAALAGKQQLELGTTMTVSNAPVLLSLRPVIRDGQVRGVAGMVNNLASVEALYRNRQDMVAMIAHDLRSPLTSIQGFGDLLAETELDEEQLEFLTIMNNESARMARLTDDFLQLSRIEAGKWSITRGVCDLAEMMRFAVAALSYEASQKDIDFRLEAPSRLDAWVDNHAMRRVITNLLSNAIKYSPAGTRVSAHVSESDDAFVLAVSDQGYGMTPEQQANLFQKYQRIDDGPQASIKGTGLGLYMVKLIITAHEGDIHVRSAVSEGSTFSITLPKVSSMTPASPAQPV